MGSEEGGVLRVGWVEVGSRVARARVEVGWSEG